MLAKITNFAITMLAFFFGLILILAPFALTGLFEDKKKGLIYLLFFVIVWHTTVAFFTQLFGIFDYKAIVSLNVLADISAIFMFFKHKNRAPKFRADIIVLMMLGIFAVNLYQVHFNYTGKINLVVDNNSIYHNIRSFNYPYPYYSDEWYSVAIIKEVITTKSLPLENPFVKGEMFVNPEMFFHSFLAELFLILRLNPLTNYALFSIVFNSLIALVLYLFLRIEKLGKLIASISSLSLLYIVSGSNLPGIWNLMPMSMGVLASLIGFCFLALKKDKLALANFIIVFLFYPPFAFIYLIALIVYFSEKKGIFDKIKKYIKDFIFYIFLAIPVFYIAINISSFSKNIVKFIFSKMFYPSFTFGMIPDYAIYKIIPWPVILISLLGICILIKNKKWLAIQIFGGLFLWSLYSFLDYRIIVEYQRIVFFTSVLLCISFGFGLDFIKKRAIGKWNDREQLVVWTQIFVIIFIAVLTPFYTQRQGWMDLYLKDKDGDKLFPKAPANMYLTDDDNRIFKNIKEKKFLSVPWKGTVIAVATDNYPISTKAGTITMNQDLFQDFSIADCSGKDKIAKEMKIDYIYSFPFFCPNFQETDRSSEGFILYKVAD